VNDYTFWVFVGGRLGKCTKENEYYWGELCADLSVHTHGDRANAGLSRQ